MQKYNFFLFNQIFQSNFSDSERKKTKNRSESLFLLNISSTFPPARNKHCMIAHINTIEVRKTLQPLKNLTRLSEPVLPTNATGSDPATFALPAPTRHISKQNCSRITKTSISIQVAACTCAGRMILSKKTAFIYATLSKNGLTAFCSALTPTSDQVAWTNMPYRVFCAMRGLC